MEKHTFCVALTKPAMLFGVTMDFLIINFVACFSLCFLTLNFIWPTIVALLAHGVMFLLCKIEPRFPDILFKKISYFDPIKQKFWGCSSYEPY